MCWISTSLGWDVCRRVAAVIFIQNNLSISTLQVRPETPGPGFPIAWCQASTGSPGAQGADPVSLWGERAGGRWAVWSQSGDSIVTRHQIRGTEQNRWDLVCPDLCQPNYVTNIQTQSLLLTHMQQWIIFSIMKEIVNSIFFFFPLKNLKYSVIVTLTLSR